MSAKHLSEILNEKSGQSVENLTKIAEFLETSVAYLIGETDESIPLVARRAERHTANSNKEYIFTMEQQQKTHSRPTILENIVQVREASKDLKSLDEHDLNAAEEMLLASLNAVRSEKNIRTAQQDGVAKSACSQGI